HRPDKDFFSILGPSSGIRGEPACRAIVKSRGEGGGCDATGMGACTSSSGGAPPPGAGRGASAGLGAAIRGTGWVTPAALVLVGDDARGCPPCAPSSGGTRQ